MSDRTAILGTAGHIDHGKTALVGALTGVDTDRLKEEKERGITIDLGFAELAGEGVRLGVVDVPGHEGFVRNMLAGATGMDMALLVVAADEGVMPQTREHLSILSLLRVSRLVVALTKIDLADDEWTELVEDDVRDTVRAAGFDEAPVMRVSSRTGEGIEALRDRLLALARERPEAADDLLALPVDRVFTVRGTGTVVTGTLVSGALRVGDRVRLLPADRSARVRGLQVHGVEVDRAVAGSRVAVALTGDGIDRGGVARGDVVVGGTEWQPSGMVTVEIRVLPATGWTLAHNQRVRVHLGTAEVMARVVLFGRDEIAPGTAGWGQLRLESPVAPRVGAAGVLRSYSPVTTIAGIRVAEAPAPKRGRATRPEHQGFAELLDGTGADAVRAVLGIAGPGGVPEVEIPLRSGRVPSIVAAALTELAGQGASPTAAGRWVAGGVIDDGVTTLVDAVDAVHEAEPYRPGIPVEALRARFASHAAPGLADLALDRACGDGLLVVERGVVSRTGFRPTLSDAQQRLRQAVTTTFREAGPTPPFIPELDPELREDPVFPVLLEGLVRDGVLVQLEHEIYIDAPTLADVVDAVRAELAGREDLGPADFREAVPVTRRHLLPILAWMDREGVTIRTGDGRRVAD
ncbi:MAG: selenocysteine-specific translation elongation factor [Gemmatimonadetes bacterium]|nr:selenocysteine-specific translation elongation factor [Gemmatimonadota bacterium]